jgi:hypothetical protein
VIVKIDNYITIQLLKHVKHVFDFVLFVSQELKDVNNVKKGLLIIKKQMFVICMLFLNLNKHKIHKKHKNHKNQCKQSKIHNHKIQIHKEVLINLD